VGTLIQEGLMHFLLKLLSVNGDSFSEKGISKTKSGAVCLRENMVTGI